MSIATTDSEKSRAILLTEHHPLTVLDALPEAVFPVSATLTMRRTREADAEHPEFRQPQTPVTVYTPTTAYIPETTVYFENPAERAPRNRKAWRVRSFFEELERVISEMSEAPGVSDDDLQLLGLEVVEVPVHLLTTDSETGATVVKPDLYDRQADLRLARFERVGGLQATAVREELAEALPGESRTPTRLTEVREVTAKPARHSRDTQGRAGTARYYTERDAEQVDDLSLTPATHRLRSEARPGDRSRPLSPILSELDSVLPELAGTDDLLRRVTFRGKTVQREVFHAEEVLGS